MGNGINFGIVLLARYVEARRRGVSMEESLAISLSGILPRTPPKDSIVPLLYPAVRLAHRNHDFGARSGGGAMVFSMRTEA